MSPSSREGLNLSDEEMERQVPNEPVDDRLDLEDDYDESDTDRRGGGFLLILVLLLLIIALLGGTAVASYYVLQAQQAAKVPQTLQDVVVRQIQAQLAKTPNNPTLYLQLAGSYYQMKDYNAAGKALSDLQAINPTGTVLALSLYGTGKIDEAQGKPDAALSSYQRSLAVTETLDTRYALGSLYLARKQYANAITNLERYVALAPSDPDGLTKLASAYEAQGNKAKALEMYQKALTFTVNDPKTLAAIKRLKGQQ